jgi:sugar-specific transcriptional regulator TrmB
MTIEQQLESLGLKKNEIKVYLAVLELGEPLVGQIEQQGKLHKQLIYQAAENLQNKGLLSIHEIRGRKRFTVADPSVLEEQVKARLSTARDLVPKLYELANKKRAADHIRIYRGKKGVQQYYLEIIRKIPAGATVYILGVNSARYFEIFNQQESAYQTFEKKRLTKKVQLKLLLFGPKESEIALNKARQFVVLRLLTDKIQAPMDIMVWHDRVGLLFYEPEAYVLDIVGQATVEGFREYIKAFWSGASRPNRTTQY